MKILMFAPIFPPAIGGPATQSFNLCRALFERGHLPVVLTPGERFECTKPNGYPVYRYPWKYTNTFLDRGIRWIIFPVYLTHVLLNERPQILHAHSVSAPSFIAVVFAKLWGMPSIIKFAGDWVWETLSTPRVRGKDFEDLYTSSLLGRLLKSVERFGVSLYDIVWVPSEFRRENVRELLGTDAKVRKIPNSLILANGGTHDEKMEPATIISANRFIPHKRVDMIVRTFAQLSDKRTRLVLIGGGEESQIEKVKKAIADAGVSDRVELTGVLSSAEIYARFGKASFYVSASLEEGFPNVFIEAMHYGLPIISTDVGGCKEMVRDGVTGFLVDPMDETQMARRMEQLVTDRDLRNTFAHAAYRESAQYDLTKVVDQFIELYETLLKKYV